MSQQQTAAKRWRGANNERGLKKAAEAISVVGSACFFVLMLL